MQKLLLGLTLLLHPAAVIAHGYLRSPNSRQLAIPSYQGDVQSLSSGGPGTVHSGGGYVHGMCGNTPFEKQTLNQPGPIMATYTEGSAVTFQVVITGKIDRVWHISRHTTPEMHMIAGSAS